MLFKDIVGQENVQQQIRQVIRSGRIPHAQLFLGPQGSGKLALALATAQYLLCENRSEDDSCGQCAACQKSGRFIHPDIHFSFPTVGSKVTSNQFLPEWRTAMSENPYLHINQWLERIGAENKQGNINKDECLNIIRKLSLKTFESTYKVLILWLPEYLGKEGNRLLKMIEEPPEQTIFLLVAEEPELILNTILSRCQLMKINQLTDEEVAAGLQQQSNLPPTEALSIARLADGNFNEAREMAGSEKNDNAARLLDWLRKAYRGSGVELVKWVEEFAGIGRENQKYFLRYALHFMREYLLLKMTADVSQVRLQPKELESAQKLTKVIGFEQVEHIVELLNTSYYHVERNAHPKILFLDVSIQLNHILKVGQPMHAVA